MNNNFYYKISLGVWNTNHMNRAKYIAMLLNFLNLQAIVDLEDKTRD